MSNKTPVCIHCGHPTDAVLKTNCIKCGNDLIDENSRKSNICLECRGSQDVNDIFKESITQKVKSFSKKPSLLLAIIMIGIFVVGYLYNFGDTKQLSQLENSSISSASSSSKTSEESTPVDESLIKSETLLKRSK